MVVLLVEFAPVPFSTRFSTLDSNFPMRCKILSNRTASVFFKSENEKLNCLIMQGTLVRQNLHITTFCTGKLKIDNNFFKKKLWSTFLLYTQNIKNHVSSLHSVGDCLCLVWHSISLAWKAMNNNRNLHIKWQHRKSSLNFFFLGFSFFQIPWRNTRHFGKLKELRARGKN